jgi:hypothetical protein
LRRRRAISFSFEKTRATTKGGDGGRARGVVRAGRTSDGSTGRQSTKREPDRRTRRGTAVYRYITASFLPLAQRTTALRNNGGFIGRTIDGRAERRSRTTLYLGRTEVAPEAPSRRGQDCSSRLPLKSQRPSDRQWATLSLARRAGSAVSVAFVRKGSNRKRGVGAP